MVRRGDQIQPVRCAEMLHIPERSKGMDPERWFRGQHDGQERGTWYGER